MALIEDITGLVQQLEKAAGDLANGAVDVAKTAVNEALSVARNIAGAVGGEDK